MVVGRCHLPRILNLILMFVFFLSSVDCGADLKPGDEKSPDGAPSSSSKSKDSKQAATPDTPSSVPETSSSTATPTKPLPLDTRAQFGANLFLLSGVELAHVIVQLERDCPTALEHLPEVDGVDGKCLDPPRLEINVDAIPASLFEELSHYVEARVGTKGAVETPVKSEDSASRPKKRKKT
jgi:hypothetical protein